MRGEDGGLERGERLARTGRVPDIAAALRRPHPLLIASDENTVQDALGRGDLIGTHHQQLAIGIEDAVAGEDVQQNVLREEGLGEIDEIGDRAIRRIGPPTRELEGVGGHAARVSAATHRLTLHLIDVTEARRVGIVFGMRSVGDHEKLNILEKTRAGPEAVASVAANLIEGFFNRNPAALQLDVNER